MAESEAAIEVSPYVLTILLITKNTNLKIIIGAY